MKIPRKFHVLYWDTNPEKLDKVKNKQYLIERALEYGDFDADKWLDTMYCNEDIVEVVKKSKRISLKTANLYILKYNLNKDEVECFKNPYTQKQHRF